MTTQSGLIASIIYCANALKGYKIPERDLPDLRKIDSDLAGMLLVAEEEYETKDPDADEEDTNG